MPKDIAFAIWFMLPAALANVAPIFAAITPGLRRWQAPMDGGRTLRGKQLLGTHKTWRGLVSGIVVAGIIFGLQQLAVRHINWLHNLTDIAGYSRLPWELGPLLGLGALGGDALKSFCKRQAGIASGKSWLPFDQLDYIIGAVLISLPFAVLPWAVYVWIFVIWFGAHLLASYIGWRTGLKESPI